MVRLKSKLYKNKSLEYYGALVFSKHSDLHYFCPMKNLVLFASGAGSNVQAIIDYFFGKDVKIAAIVCNKEGAGVLQIAANHEIPVEMIDKQRFSNQAFLEKLQSYNADLLVLAGFLWKVPNTIVGAFPNKIVNIHPALLPNYGGKGMYGSKVHEAVINAQEKESGITIHWVNEHYDEGNIIVQARCTISKTDTAHSLAQNIHKLEHYFYPRTIEFILG